MTVSIGEITKNDVPCVAQIEKECFSVPFSEDDISSYIESPIWHFLVARDGDCVLGYISFTVILDECQIVNVAVTNSARGRGIGSQIITHFLSCIKEKGVGSVYLEVRESNTPAIGLYKKFGFFPIFYKAEQVAQPLSWNNDFYLRLFSSFSSTR